ncbi:MAG: phage terminase large subunit [Candidatus Paceibacterota bacterium]
MSLDPKQKAILKEIKRRVQAVQAADARPKFDLDKYFFPKQFEFFRGTANRFKVAVCSRRAGKTIGIIGDALDICLSTPKARVLYITLTRENCVEIIWPDLMATLEEFQIPCKINQQRLSVTFANGSYFSCAGAKDKREIGKFRGRKLSRIYIDEAQNFPAYIQDMIEADLIPTLRDLKGSMLVTGTPGPLKRGFFYGISTNGQWESHRWTAFENPHMHNPAMGKDLEQTLEEERQVRNIDKNDPSYIRETYGIWSEDFDSLVFKFKKEVNVSSERPKDLTYVFGIDLGYNDADAIAVLGYSHSTGKVYLVEEWVERKQDITDLVNQIELLRTKYGPVRMVMDAGALGKKIQEEIKRRHAIPVEAADKNRKFEFIKLLNDDFKTGKFQTFENSKFEEDCYLVQWDRNVEDPTKIKVSNSYHSDICDAVLYAWRECNHYFKQEIEVKHSRSSNEFMDALEAQEAEALELKQQGHLTDWGVDGDDLKSVFGDEF